MSMMVISGFLILAIMFGAFKKRSLAWSCGVVALLIFYVIGSGLLPKVLLPGLQSRPRLEPQWKSVNAIVVLGSGSAQWPKPGPLTSVAFGYARMHEGARLYNLCKKQNAVCKLYLTGGDPYKRGQSEAEMMARELEDLGISREDLVIEPKSNNTFQNAQFTSELLRAENPDYTVLVTSGVHMSRSLTYFSHFQIAAVAAPADYIPTGFSWMPHSPNFIFVDWAIHEHGGLLRYWFYNLMGWNPVVSKPGAL